MIPHGLEHVRLHDGHPKAMVRSAASWRLPNMCHARQTRSNKWIYHSYRTRRPRKCHKEEVSKKGELFWDMDGSANPLMDRPAVEALNLPHSLSLSLSISCSLSKLKHARVWVMGFILWLGSAQTRNAADSVPAMLIYWIITDDPNHEMRQGKNHRKTADLSCAYLSNCLYIYFPLNLSFYLPS